MKVPEASKQCLEQLERYLLVSVYQMPLQSLECLSVVVVLAVVLEVTSTPLLRVLVHWRQDTDIPGEPVLLRPVQTEEFPLLLRHPTIVAGEPLVHVGLVDLDGSFLVGLEGVGNGFRYLFHHIHRQGTGVVSFGGVVMEASFSVVVVYIIYFHVPALMIPGRRYPSHHTIMVLPVHSL